MHAGKFYVYATGGGLPDLYFRRRLDLAAGGHVAAGACPADVPGPTCSRAAATTPGPLTSFVRATSTSSTIRPPAPNRRPRSGCSSARPSILMSPDYTWEDGGPVVWSDGVEDSNAIDPGVFRDPTTGSLWLTYGSYLRLHPSRRVESEDRAAPVSQPQARQHRHQLRSLDHDLSRRLVLSARHARIVLRGRELDLQHPHGTGAESHGPVSRQHGRRHAAGRRKAVPRFERTLHRPGTFRLARAWRRRAEVLVPLRSRPRSGWYQRARHSTAALARRLARGWRQRPRG